MTVENLDEMKNLEDRIKYSYDKIWFHKLNEKKVEKIVGFWFEKPRIKACLIGGIRENCLLFPYSSPFAMIETLKECKNEELESFIEEIDIFACKNEITQVKVKLPPMIYDEPNITKCLGAFLRDNYQVCELELNFQIEVEDEEHYKNRLHRNGRKNLNHALEQNFCLHYCFTENEKYTAYEIIRVNRQSKNYYLSMTWDEVKNTIRYMEHDFFILTLNGKNIASAIVFKVTDDIWQVVYWGELPGQDDARPMNYLPYALCRFYKEKGIRVLDIGPSMLNGKPNYGLCDFKESIGCTVSSKFVLRKEFIL